MILPLEPPTAATIRAGRAAGEPMAMAILDAWLEQIVDDELAIEAMVSNMTPEMAAVMADARASRGASIRGDVERREWEHALDSLGSHQRLGLLADWWQLGCLTVDELRDILPGVWSMAEPDDTDPLWRRLWTAAGAGSRIETEPMPDGDPLVIYRGEPEAPARKTRGIAWSLDRDVAVFFALRPPGSDGTGVVIEASCPRAVVLGYVTDRQESEVIVLPKHVKVTAIVPVSEVDRPPKPAAP